MNDNIIDFIYLSRDYIKNPLQMIKQSSNNGLKYETIDYNDLVYLYIDLNMSIKQLSNYFHISSSAIKSQLKYYNIKKVKLKQEIIKVNTNNLQRDYITNPLTIIQNGSCRTIEYPSYSDIYELYINQNLSSKDLCNYFGVGLSFILKVLSEYHIHKSNKQQYQSRKNKMINHYGYENNFQSESSKSKISNKLNDIIDSRFQTMKKNHTLGSTTSKSEIKLFNLIKNKYPSCVSQYKSKDYPFKCDFYIPEIDTYIEYQGYWHHNNHPYNPNNDIDNQILIQWNNKLNNGHISYKRAIEIWTIEDVNKRNWAKEHHLNWLEFFDSQSLINWLNTKKD